MTLSRRSSPSMASCAPGGGASSPRRRRTATRSTSRASELFPEPLTPVRQVQWPSGKATAMFCRLWWRAPFTVREAALARAGAPPPPPPPPPPRGGGGGGGAVPRRGCVVVPSGGRVGGGRAVGGG